MDDGLLSSECCFDLSIQHNESFFKVMTMRAGSAARRDVHVDHAEAAICVLSIDSYGVGIADQTDVGMLSCVIGIGRGQVAIEIVWRNRRKLCL